jgi:hypothetical protein
MKGGGLHLLEGVFDNAEISSLYAAMCSRALMHF